MSEPYWKCPICIFEAANEEERLDHLHKMINDPEHRSAQVDEEELIEVN